MIESSSMAELLVRNIPPDVRKALRFMALEKSISMNQLVLDILAKAVRDHGKK